MAMDVLLLSTHLVFGFGHAAHAGHVRDDVTTV
jgi:hypothetical protein